MTQLRTRLPLLFLIVTAAGWAWYYRHPGAWNDHGAAQHDWLYLLDVLLVLPMLCWVCIRDRRAALIKALVLVGLAIGLGAWVIPPAHQQLWPHLAAGRYVLLGVIVLLEVVAVLSVVLAVRAALREPGDPDEAVEAPIRRWVGDGPLATLLALETRVWTYALLARHIHPARFSGERHYSYHHKDGGASNLLAFIVIMLFELPLLHLLLHWMWSPWAAVVVSTLTAVGLVFFIAEYRAVSRRPVSMDHETLHIRYGLNPRLSVPLSQIERVQRWTQPVRRARVHKRYRLAGTPNVALHLRTPVGTAHTVYLSLDEPARFLRDLGLALATEAAMAAPQTLRPEVMTCTEAAIPACRVESRLRCSTPAMMSDGSPP